LFTDKDKIRLQLSWPWWRWILTGLNTLALVMSVILSWHYLEGGSMIGCSGGSPCDQVINSQWSMVAGILPVSGLAVGTYLALFIASLFIGSETDVPIRRMAWSVMLILVGSVAGSAIWFTIVQKWIIGDFCRYCMTTHITGLLLAALVIWRVNMEFDDHSDNIPMANPAMIQNVSLTKTRRTFRPLRVMGLAMIGLVLAGILAAYQLGCSPSAVYRSGESQDKLPVIDYQAVPLVGSPDAPYVVTLLFDYQCPHCQKLHFMLDEAIRRYDGKLAFTLCPAPLNSQCNPYIPKDVDEFKNSCELAKISLAIWLANREAFPAFENWMYTYESGNSWRPRSLDSARVKAAGLVGQEKFNTAWDDAWIGQYLQTSIRIYGQTIQSGNGGIPKLIFGSRWVVPEPNSANDLIRILQKSLGMPEP
jgi:uncharacterized membrane protein/protein-disulfide isomerase